jgi:hypothetical protein
VLRVAKILRLHLKTNDQSQGVRAALPKEGTGSIIW